MPLPEPGFELVDANGEVVAEGELVWESAKIAVFRPGYETDQEEFRQRGWKTISIDAAGILDQLEGELL